VNPNGATASTISLNSAYEEPVRGGTSFGAKRVLRTAHLRGDDPLIRDALSLKGGTWDTDNRRPGS